MAVIKVKMQALGTEPLTCSRKFNRGEMMIAVEYDNGLPAGWHTQECITHWIDNGSPLCVQGEELK